MATQIDITDIVKNVHTDTHGNREYPQRFIAWTDGVVVGAAESIEGIQADVIHCCRQAGIEVPASILVWDQGQTPSPIDIRLWIEDSKMSDSEIRDACGPAEEAILASGFSIDEAYQASLAECDGREYVPAALAAWQAAEAIALEGVAEERAILTVA